MNIKVKFYRSKKEAIESAKEKHTANKFWIMIIFLDGAAWYVPSGRMTDIIKRQMNKDHSWYKEHYLSEDNSHYEIEVNCLLKTDFNDFKNVKYMPHG